MGNPIKRFKANSITATVWENVYEQKSGQERKLFSVSLEKSYRDKEEWKKTTNLTVNDIPRAILVYQQAYQYLTQEAYTNKD